MTTKLKCLFFALSLYSTSVALSAVPAKAEAPVAADTSTVAAMGAIEADELAKKLSNPVSSLISVPFQLNFDDGYAGGGSRWTMNIQPVAPFSLNAKWNVISRTILPVITQGGNKRNSGLGDIVQSFFFSPKAPTGSGWIWGAGPVFLAPTGADAFTVDQWGIGPTAVALKQVGPWTYGALVNHIWGSGDTRPDVNATFLQPFVAKALGQGVTLTANLESTYDWTGEQWTIPLNVLASKVTKLGSTMVSVFGGARVYLDAPDGGPDWGLRMGLTLLYPK
jgi:hypothetical protein